jgi:hypothetical protein
MLGKMNIFLPYHLLHGYDPSRARVTRPVAERTVSPARIEAVGDEIGPGQMKEDHTS